jgi:hypothetical protein
MGLDEILNSYFLDTQLGYTTEQRFYENLLNEGILDKLNITRKDIKEFYATLPTDQIHTENNRIFIPIEVNSKLDQFQIDLIVIIKRKATKKTNAVLHYILTVIDVYSRKASCRYLKNKKSSSTAKAFKEILDELGIPKELRGDKGNEWGGDFLKLCKQNNIKLILRDGDGKYLCWVPTAKAVVTQGSPSEHSSFSLVCHTSFSQSLVCTNHSTDGRNFHRGIGGESRRIFISLIDDSLHDLKKERITAANGRVYLGVYKATAISIIDIVQGINDEH